MKYLLIALILLMPALSYPCSTDQECVNTCLELCVGQECNECYNVLDSINE